MKSWPASPFKSQTFASKYLKYSKCVILNIPKVSLTNDQVLPDLGQPPLAVLKLCMLPS